MKSEPVLPGGSLKSRPTWWITCGCVPPRRLFCFSGDLLNEGVAVVVAWRVAEAELLSLCFHAGKFSPARRRSGLPSGASYHFPVRPELSGDRRRRFNP